MYNNKYNKSKPLLSESLCDDSRRKSLFSPLNHPIRINHLDKELQSCSNGLRCETLSFEDLSYEDIKKIIPYNVSLMNRASPLLNKANERECDDSNKFYLNNYIGQLHNLSQSVDVDIDINVDIDDNLIDKSRHKDKYSLKREEIIEKFYNPPVISIGIIAFYIDYPYEKNSDIKKIIEYEKKNVLGTNNNKICEYNHNQYDHIKILMIQRKNTMGYNDLIRGRYFYNDPSYITKIFFEEMTEEERYKIRTMSFDDLWKDLWKNNINSKHYKYDYKRSKYKYSKLNIRNLLNITKSKYTYTEFGLPKGRLGNKESNLECAKREFKEETNYVEKDYNIINELNTIEENFLGTNNILYRHIYYFAEFNKDIKKPKICEENEKQIEEVLNVDFLSYNEIISLLRPYEKSKIELFTNIFKIINDYVLLSK